MKKICSLLVLVCLFSGNVKAQTGIDTVAVSILDHMSAMIGELKSCSVVAKSNYDVASQDLGLVKHADEQHVYIGGPDKLLVRSEGDKGNHYVVYNGKT